ncbi:MAG: hypothetical protein KJ847_06410 [Firmicutes bacterium]|nr:hypothetical protein [Bacillota bacterium]
MKTIKEMFSYIFAACGVFIYLSAIFRGEMIIAYMFTLTLYLLPFFLFFGERISKLPFTKPSKKVDDFKDIKRMKVMIPIVFTIIAFVMVFAQEYKILDIWYWDLLITLVSVWIFSLVIIVILNFFFSRKTLFDNNKKTDEFITILTSVIFLGLLTVFSVGELSSSVFILIYFGLILNFLIYVYKIIEAIVYFDISEQKFFSFMKSITLIITLMVTMIYIQNSIVYNNYSTSFIGIELNPYFDIFYYTIVNLTSVGFGDITPQNYFVKIVSIESSVFGYIMFFTIVGLFISKAGEVFKGEAKDGEEIKDQ